MSAIFKQSFVMSAGTVTNSLLGLIFYVVIARFLGISDFGRLSFLLGLGILAAEIGDFGLGSALVKFGSGQDLRGVFTLAFLQRIIMLTIFLFLAFLAGAAYPANFYLSALVGASLQFLSLITQTFLARQKYGLYVAVNILGNICRLGLIWFFWSSSRLGVETTLWGFLGASFLAFAAGFIVILLMLLPSPFSPTEARKVFVPVWQYSRWVALSYTVASFGAKIDIPIVYVLAGSTATGIYTSAQKLASVFSQIAASIEGVFAPKFSSGDARVLKNYIAIAILVSLGLLILPWFSGLFLTFAFGQKYLTATPAFNILVLGLIPFFLSGPFSASVLYRFGKSSYHLAISVGQLAVGLLGYMLFVPVLGANGAALAALVINLFGFVGYFALYQKIK